MNLLSMSFWPLSWVLSSTVPGPGNNCYSPHLPSSGDAGDASRLSCSLTHWPRFRALLSLSSAITNWLQYIKFYLCWPVLLWFMLHTTCLSSVIHSSFSITVLRSGSPLSVCPLSQTIRNRQRKWVGHTLRGYSLLRTVIEGRQLGRKENKRKTHDNK